MWLYVVQHMSALLSLSQPYGLDMICFLPKQVDKEDSFKTLLLLRQYVLAALWLKPVYVMLTCN